MSTLNLDIETFSAYDLKKGVYGYAEHPSTEVTLMQWALGNEPVTVWDVTADPNPPGKLLRSLITADDLLAHNSTFERIVLGKSKYADLFKDKKWRDTMIRALAHGLPGALSSLCDIFKLPVDKAKDKAGKDLIRLFCKPRPTNSKIRRATRLTHPAEWAHFMEYARLDVEAMRELDRLIPRWNDTAEERALWRLDQRINDRGFLCDTDLIDKAILLVESEKVKRDARTKAMTAGEVNAATQRDALLKHLLEEYEVTLPDMRASTLERRVNDDDLPEPVRELLRLRLESAGTSTKKYSVMRGAVCTDGRMRGNLLFCGASRTGRWSGKGGNGAQFHNLPKPHLKLNGKDLRDHDLTVAIQHGIDAIKSGTFDIFEGAWYDSPVELLSSAVRGVIIAKPGHCLPVADLSAIEGRVLAWLAGEKWKLQAYRDLDAGRSKYDMYKLTFATTFGCDPAEVEKFERQMGKVIELFGGYQGGVGAFITFSKTMGVDLQEIADRTKGKLDAKALFYAQAYWDVCKKNKKNTHGLSEEVFVACDAIKRMWRANNPAIERYWYDTGDAVRRVLTRKDAGRIRVGRCVIDKAGSWLRIQLPSGRFLCYPGAHLEGEKQITYLGVNQYTKQWGRIKTYDGRLVENITQAAARDILAHGALEAENRGFEVVLSVHDELITEAPDTPEFTGDTLAEIMSINPPWADGLPLAAAGFTTYRYRKD